MHFPRRSAMDCQKFCQDSFTITVNNDRKHTFAVMEKSISTRWFVILTPLSIELSCYDQKIIRIHSSEKKTRPSSNISRGGSVNLTIALLLLFMKMLQNSSCMSNIITTDHKKKLELPKSQTCTEFFYIYMQILLHIVHSSKKKQTDIKFEHCMASRPWFPQWYAQPKVIKEYSGRNSLQVKFSKRRNAEFSFSSLVRKHYNTIFNYILNLVFSFKIPAVKHFAEPTGLT